MDLVLAFRDLKSMYFGTNIFAPVATVAMIFMKKIHRLVRKYVFYKMQKQKLLLSNWAKINKGKTTALLCLVNRWSFGNWIIC